MNTELSAMQPYLQQVQLLVQVLPVVFREKDFALKGGTAINLFVRDLPRLSVDVSLDDLVAARQELVQRLHAGLTASDKHFLVAFKRGDPDWNRSGFPGIEDLPALRWKQHNLERMDPAKRMQAVSRLEGLLADVGAAAT